MDTYLSKSWLTLYGMIDAFFLLLPKIILAIVVFVLFWLLGIVVNRLVGYISRKYRRARNLSIVLGRVSHAVVIVLGLLVSLTIVAPTARVAPPTVNPLFNSDVLTWMIWHAGGVGSRAPAPSFPFEMATQPNRINAESWRCYMTLAENLRTKYGLTMLQRGRKCLPVTAIT